MSVIFPMEFIFSPKITYVLFENNMPRRIYTDGRDWPKDPEPTFAGYSIGKWIDETETAGSTFSKSRHVT
jgi:hypothetical protein